MTAPLSGPARTTPLARNRYQEGQILRARDLERESDYFLARDRQHNGLAHGFGILLGLELTATEAAGLKPVTEEELRQNGPKPIDLSMNAGAAIDGLGRLLIVPKRVPISSLLATNPSVLPADTYRVELYYRHCGGARGSVNGARCADAERVSVLEECYGLRLTRHDPAAPGPRIDTGAVLDGPLDDPARDSPIIIGIVEWSGTAYVGYTTSLRTYAPVQAQQVHAPSNRAELDLFDGDGRFAVRFAAMPPPNAPDPFSPGPMRDRFRVDADGSVWVPADVSVGREGIGFRREADPLNPENTRWRVTTVIADPGAQFGLDEKGDPLAVGAYASGNRELRVLFQREGSDTGKHRVVVGHVDENGGAFQPALVIYDRPKQGEGTGSATVEVWGDLHVRGTAWLNAAARRPSQPGPGIDELDMLLRQLAGPFAGAFRVFLTSDAQWLEDFGKVMAQQVNANPAMQTAFVDAIKGQVATALRNDQAFTGPLVAAAVNQVSTSQTVAIALHTLLLSFIDSATVPARQLLGGTLATAFRQILRDPNVYNQLIAQLAPDPTEKTKVKDAFDWLPAPP